MEALVPNHRLVTRSSHRALQQFGNVPSYEFLLVDLGNVEVEAVACALAATVGAASAATAVPGARVRMPWRLA
jgi:hypothetical protein